MHTDPIISYDILKWSLLNFTIIAFGEFKIILLLHWNNKKRCSQLAASGVVDAVKTQALEDVLIQGSVVEIQNTADEAKDKLTMFAEEELEK